MCKLTYGGKTIKKTTLGKSRPAVGGGARFGVKAVAFKGALAPGATSRGTKSFQVKKYRINHLTCSKSKFVIGLIIKTKAPDDMPMICQLNCKNIKTCAKWECEKIRRTSFYGVDLLAKICKQKNKGRQFVSCPGRHKPLLRPCVKG